MIYIYIYTCTYTHIHTVCVYLYIKNIQCICNSLNRFLCAPVSSPTCSTASPRNSKRSKAVLLVPQGFARSAANNLGFPEGHMWQKRIPSTSLGCGKSAKKSLSSTVVMFCFHVFCKTRLNLECQRVSYRSMDISLLVYH